MELIASVLILFPRKTIYGGLLNGPYERGNILSSYKIRHRSTERWRTVICVCSAGVYSKPCAGTDEPDTDLCIAKIKNQLQDMKILFMLTVFSGLCGVCMAQQKKGNNKSQWADLALTAGSSQGAGVLS